MNALSKVLIVLVLVLSVGFAVSQMVLYGKREHYGELYMEEHKARGVAEAAQQDSEKGLRDVKAQLDQLRLKTDGEIQELKQDLADEQGRARDLTTQNTGLTAAMQGATNQIDNLMARNTTLQDTNEGLQGQVKERDESIKKNLDTIDGLQTTVAEREGTIGDLEHELTEQKKAYQQLALSEERLQAIVGELVERGVHVPPAPLPVINGRVVRVDLEHGVAVVDKGSEAGVKPNTQFTIYDDDGYIARLVIHDVQPEVSAGRVRLLVEDRDIRQGDKVTTEIP
ncbi:MAG: hypothetical protein AMK73_04915 [Planctomycetes bacterium SM23_32]|nr:MAG: hypothetical protein AMK73_04915 [Planctomycetes bacterium SM23_32]